MAIKWETKVIMENPKATISAGAIGLNGTASELLGKASSVVVGYDEENRSIVVAPSSAVKEKSAVSHDIKPSKNGASIRCRAYMPVILNALNVKLEDKKRIKCNVETEKDMLFIKLP